MNKLSKLSFITLIIVMCMSVMVWADDTPAGSGTIEDPYQIGTLDELYWFVDLVNNSTLSADEKLNAHNAKLTADIVVNSGTLNANTNANRVSRWDSISNYNAIFDGNGHTISGIYYNEDKLSISDAPGGFIANTVSYDAKIQNLTISNSYFASNREIVGVICGKTQCNISNCHSVNNIVNAGTNTSRLGGICGQITQNSNKEMVYISNCTNASQVTGSSYVGGIIGETGEQNDYVSFYIQNCKNSGNISGKGKVGGILSYAYGNVSEYSTIEYCSNEGTVTRESQISNNSTDEIKSYCGGIVGQCNSGCYIKTIIISVH